MEDDDFRTAGGPSAAAVWIASVALPSLAVLLAAALASGTLQATWNEFQGQEDNRQHEHDAYAIGLWGDVPYSDLQATVGVPNLLADMNRHALAFSVHDGDLKTGNGAPICDDALVHAFPRLLQRPPVAGDVHAR